MPLSERLVEEPDGGCGPGLRVRGVDQLLEANGIDGGAGDAQPVAHRTGLDRCADGLQRLAQSGDVALQRVARGRGGFLAPQRRDQVVDGDDRAVAHDQPGEKRALLGAGDVDDPARGEDFERAEHPKLHRRSLPHRPSVEAVSRPVLDQGNRKPGSWPLSLRPALEGPRQAS